MDLNSNIMFSHFVPVYILCREVLLDQGYSGLGQASEQKQQDMDWYMTLIIINSSVHMVRVVHTACKLYAFYVLLPHWAFLV